MQGERAAMGGIIRGFLPWIAFWSLSGAGWPLLGALVALAVTIGTYVRQGRRWRAMELTALAFFSARAAAGLALDPDVLRSWDAPLASGALGAMAWLSLLADTPFTLQYARDGWPREYWTAPLFRRINALLTAAWAVIFSVNTALGLLAITWSAGRFWLAHVLPHAAIAGGVALSIVVPRRYPRRWAAKEIKAREPYTWPTPVVRRGRFSRADQHDVVVIGAGIGGLTAGALLAQRGLDVLVLDQHYLAGGFCTSWPRLVRRGEERLRYVFDAGVHDVSGLGPRGPVRHLLRQLDLETRLDWRPMTHEYILPGQRLVVPHRVEEFVDLLASRFPSDAAGVRAFFAEIEYVYRELYADVDETGGVPVPPGTVDGMLAYPSRHPHAFRWMRVPFGVMLETYLHDPDLKRLLAILSGYLSDNPAVLTVGAMAPIFGYYLDGGYYPAGGSQTLADTLTTAIREHGGAVRLRTPVHRILVEHGRVGGVEVADGQIHRARAIVSNADARRTFLDLVGPAHLPDDFTRQVERLRPSTSAFTVFLGVECVPDIAPITIVHDDGGGFAVAVPSKVNPSLAPVGHASVSIVTLVPSADPWDRRAPGYTARKRSDGDALIARAERVIPGLARRIVYRQDGSPATCARYAWTTGGAIYGPAAGAWRPPAKSPVEGLVLAGAGVFPGAGVEAVVISGTLAADALCPVARSTDREVGVAAIAE